MRWLILMMSAIVAVQCRPQTENPQSSGSTVENSSKVTILPFYGGAKGQSLQITETSDGKVTTAIIKSPEETEGHQENSIDTAELENPPLPSKFDTDDFGSNIRNIQKTAAEIIKLQEIAKRTGSLSESQETQYQEGMDNLSQTALKLANMQDESNPSIIENREGLSAWFERKMPNKNKDKNKEGEDKKKKDSEKNKKEEEAKRKETEQKKKQEEEKRRKEEENKKKQEEEEEVAQETDEDDTIGIDLPDKDASVAEAKPVGLAIAGEGGVAASKPIATAVVGRGGLAIARPVGTAIAGIDPKDPLYPTYIQNYVHGGKTKISSTNSNKQDSANEYLNRLISKYHQI